LPDKRKYRNALRKLRLLAELSEHEKILYARRDAGRKVGNERALPPLARLLHALREAEIAAGTPSKFLRRSNLGLHGFRNIRVIREIRG
jgi:hypothetical protein